MVDLRVVAGAVVRGGRVLVARRGPSMELPGMWELPGGKVEPGESDAEALVRELDEELDVHVEVGPHLATSRHRGLVLVAYRCRLLRGIPSPVEHAEVRWVAPWELSDLGWAPADVALLDAVRDACHRSNDGGTEV